jgi:hypothetical protein
MGEVRIKQATGIEPIGIKQVSKVSPAAVHIKELNNVDPFTIESLRIDQVRNLDPVRIDEFHVTHLPTVNLTLSQFPGIDLSVRRFPPIAIGIQQDFHLPSKYTVHARFLGVEIMQLNIHGCTMIRPQDRHCREVVRTHERSSPEAAAVGNPCIAKKATGRGGPCLPGRPPHQHPCGRGARPHFSYSIPSVRGS